MTDESPVDWALVDLTTADPLIGQLFDGRYRVDSRVARGGMATVYTGFDTRLDRVVAIKVMHQALAEDDAFVARFHREAKSAARLSHPNVVAIFDQGSDAGRVFLVMEHIDGGTLRERLRTEGRLSPAVALGIMEPVLQALAAAHDAGIVHRDVKPENILISSDGRVKVADFGLARAIETTGMTTTGLLIGTVSYLAPEQVSDGRADTRSDVYAAGIVLFELLTGSPPYDGDTPLSVAYRHVHDSVPAPSTLLEGVPPELDEVILRATHRDPDARPSTARHLLVGLRRAQQAVARAGATTALRPVADALTLVTPIPVRRSHNSNHTSVLRAPAAGQPAVVGPVQRRKRMRPSTLAALLITLALIAAAVVGWRLGLTDDSPNDSTASTASNSPAASSAAQSSAPTTPPPVLVVTDEVRKLTFNAAAAKLKLQGFSRVDATYIFSEDVAKDIVIDQTPKPQMEAEQGAVATLVVSKGPERVAVPKVVGLLGSKAVAALDAARLASTVTERFDEKVAKNLVISADPAPGEQVNLRSNVRLVVSKGRQPLPVPAVKGLAYAAAAKRVTDAGFKAARKDSFSATVKTGLVISQSPATGTAYRNDVVSLTVSKGPPPVPMPSVVGMARAAAVKKLQGLGLRVQLVDFPGLRGRTVARQTPEQGTLVPRGNTVVIYLF